MVRRYVLPIIAIALFLTTGYSIIGAPEREIVCDYSLFTAVCEQSSCTIPVILKIGNTGAADLDRVDVILPETWAGNLLRDPKVQRFGVLPMKYSRESPSLISFGSLESAKWVELHLFIGTSDPAGIEKRECTSLISAPGAKVLRGSPEFLRFGRFLYRLLTLI